MGPVSTQQSYKDTGGVRIRGEDNMRIEAEIGVMWSENRGRGWQSREYSGYWKLEKTKGQILFAKPPEEPGLADTLTLAW